MISENTLNYLYHGTIKEYVNSIVINGLVPKIGHHTRTVYKQDIIPLVFLSDVDNLFRCVSAMGNHINWFYGIDKPDCFRKAAIHEFGAIAIVEYNTDIIQYVPDEFADDDVICCNHVQVEPGNYFSESKVPVVGVLCGDDLVELLASKGEFEAQ